MAWQGRGTPTRAAVLARLYLNAAQSIEDEQITLTREGGICTWARTALGLAYPPGSQIPPLIHNAFKVAQSLAWDGISVTDDTATSLLMAVEP